MKNVITTCLFILFSLSISAQVKSNVETGKVSYVSSQNIYVKFDNTDEINVGDTLLILKNNQFIPALLVENKSSISCVCKPIIENVEILVADEVRSVKFEKIVEPEIKEPEKTEEKTKPTPPAAVIPVTPEKEEEDETFKQNIKGRISAASYSNMSNGVERHRMRYAFSFRGNNLKNSRFSTDNYITFRHTIGEWDRVKNNLSDALKIYSLSAKYDFNKSSSLTVGRKINPRISNMGAIDGLQYEHGAGQIKLGAIAGSRPNFADYGVDFSLMQAGVYISHSSDNTTKYQQSTLGFIEQHNGTSVDRRFVYFQHSNSLAKNLNLFTSFEFDLYEKINNEIKNKVDLTNIYASLRYRFSRKLSVSASYDARKNIVYYESYKNTIDSLFENETRQGLRFGLNIKPHKLITLGINSGLRFQKGEGNLSRNANAYLSISRLPVINARASLTSNFLETGYIKSFMYGARLSKDIIKRKVSTEVYFRRVNSKYLTSETTIQQDIYGASCSVRILKKLSFYVYYEGTFNKEKPTQTRFNTKLIQRF